MRPESLGHAALELLLDLGAQWVKPQRGWEGRYQKHWCPSTSLWAQDVPQGLLGLFLVGRAWVLDSAQASTTDLG